MYELLFLSIGSVGIFSICTGVVGALLVERSEHNKTKKALGSVIQSAKYSQRTEQFSKLPRSEKFNFSDNLGSNAQEEKFRRLKYEN